jgi:hypothetical protein
MLRTSPARGRPVVRTALVLAGLACVAGCGARTYPVQGKLVWPDGSPVTGVAGGSVIFESTDQPLSARGEVMADGTFVLCTYKPGDGVHPGRYRVAISQPLEEGKDGPPSRIFLEKYENPKSSGLEATVEPKPNDFTFTLERAPGRRGRR